MLKTSLLAATLAALLASSAFAGPRDGAGAVGDPGDAFAAEPSDGPPPFAERQRYPRRAPSYGAGGPDQGAFSGGADDRPPDDLAPPDEQRRSRRHHGRHRRHDEAAPYWGAPFVDGWSYGQPQPHEPPPPSIPGVRNGLYYY